MGTYLFAFLSLLVKDIGSAVVNLTTITNLCHSHPTQIRKKIHYQSLTDNIDWYQCPEHQDYLVFNEVIQLIAEQCIINSPASLDTFLMQYLIAVFIKREIYQKTLNYRKFLGPTIISILQAWSVHPYFSMLRQGIMHNKSIDRLFKIVKRHDIFRIMKGLHIKHINSFDIVKFGCERTLCQLAFWCFKCIQSILLQTKLLWAVNDDTLIIAPMNLDFLTSHFFSYKKNFRSSKYLPIPVFLIIKKKEKNKFYYSYIAIIGMKKISNIKKFWFDESSPTIASSVVITQLVTRSFVGGSRFISIPRPVCNMQGINLDDWVSTIYEGVLPYVDLSLLTGLVISAVQKSMQLFSHLQITVMFAKASEETSEPENKEGDETDNDEEEKDNQASSSVPPPTTYINCARAVDIISRAAFPGFFLGFNIIYWPYYLLNQQSHIAQ
ncbi:unnamed protein product, partial [Meganyctiphanes norvegica]